TARVHVSVHRMQTPTETSMRPLTVRKFAALNLLFASLLVAACVTINVYFPAAAAEKAADRIIDDVLGKKQIPATPPQGNQTSSNQTSRLAPEPSANLLVTAAGAVLNFLI